MLTDAQFNRLARLAYDRWGLELCERKRTLVDNRIAKLMRHGSFPSVDALISETHEQALLEIFDALSTNHTSFFRESEHFDRLIDDVVAAGVPRFQRLRIWSAACSNGCEPYSIAMTLLDHVPDLARRDVKILATDLSDSALDVARRATYPVKSIRGVSSNRVEAYFDLLGDQVRVRHHVRDFVTFGRVNLMERWQMHGPFDAIFCRNVMIYFDAPTKEKLIQRLVALLRPGGLFCVGVSESLMRQVPGLQVVSPGAYRKVPGGAA